MIIKSKHSDGTWRAQGVHPTAGSLSVSFDHEPTQRQAADALNVAAMAEVKRARAL